MVVIRPLWAGSNPKIECVLPITVIHNPINISWKLLQNLLHNLFMNKQPERHWQSHDLLGRSKNLWIIKWLKGVKVQQWNKSDDNLHHIVVSESSNINNQRGRTRGEPPKHGSISFMSITIKLQLHLILPITITVTKLFITIAFSSL